jgi:hypothetical protein
MDDVYEINVAKARLREAYNAGNVDLLLTAFADEFTDMSSGKPSFFGADAKSVFRMRMTSVLNNIKPLLSSPSSLFVYLPMRLLITAGIASLCLRGKVASPLPPERDTSRLGRKPPAESGRSISTLTTWM